MMVKHLCPLPVGHGLSPGEPLNGALRAAAQNGHLHVVQYQDGVDPSAHDNTRLVSAVKGGRVEIVKCLCSLPAEPGVNPCPGRIGTLFALTVAVNNSHIDAVKFLCSLPAKLGGVDPGASDNNALQTAVRQGD